MPNLHRTIDEYNGIKLCDMDREALNTFLGAIAERGAFNALQHVGLHDENAGEDVRDLRALLSGYRVVRKTVWKGIWSQIGRTISVILTLVLVGALLKDSPHVKEIVKVILP